MTIFERLALKVENAGGRAFYVGGYVRDKALGCQNKDIDIEVHGISEEELEKILSEFGNIKFFGSSFGVYSISGINADISLPRSERKIGIGFKSGVELGKMLELAHKLRLAGVSKEKVLKQVLAVYRKK